MKRALPNGSPIDGDPELARAGLMEVDERQERRIAELVEEYETANLDGQTTSLESFISRHQDVAEPLRDCLEGLQLLRAATATSTPTPVLLPPGTRLGDFEIQRELGRGAMGVVYQARQLSLPKTVAIKILLPATVVSSSRIERFRREALATSSLDHPNIVPVYQVGEDSGFHYYVMRYITGASLGRETTLHDLGASAYRQLALAMTGVADALHAAHQQGIVHRDIKPSNLIMDQTGRIWVTDFGLARYGTIGELTQSGELVGTLRYMSPEQAEGRSDAVDGRSDVYGIGATLYELLSGRLLYDGYEGIELLRQLRHSEPKSLRKLRPELPGDLVTIVERAMRPDKASRYQTAAELADDLRRFAEGKAISARSVSLGERARNWTRRNLAAVLTALGLALLGLVVTVIHNQILKGEQARTHRNYVAARQAVDRLGARLAERLVDFPGAEIVRQEVLAETLWYYEQFIANSENDPRLRLDVARTRIEIARLQLSVDDRVGAQQQYEAALETLDPTESEEGRFLSVQALNGLAMLLSDQGEQEAALELLKKIDLTRLSRAENASSDAVLASALTLNHLAIIRARAGSAEDAVDDLKQAVELLDGASDQFSGDQRMRGQLADAMSNLSTLIVEQGYANEALELAKHAVFLRNQMDQKDLGTLQHQAIAQSNLAAISLRAGKPAEAIASFRIAVELLERVLAERPGDPFIAGRLAVATNNLAMALSGDGASAEAESRFTRARKYVETALEHQPRNAHLVRTAAGIMNNLGVLLRDSRRPSEARQMFENAVQHQLAASDLVPPSDHDQAQLSQIRRNLQSVESIR